MSVRLADRMDLCVRALVALWFLVPAILKGIDPSLAIVFARQALALDEGWARLLVVLAVVVEGTVGSLLLCHPSRRVIWVGLLVIVVQALWSIGRVLSGEEASCGCFGALELPSVAIVVGAVVSAGLATCALFLSKGLARIVWWRAGLAASLFVALGIGIELRARSQAVMVTARLAHIWESHPGARVIVVGEWECGECKAWVREWAGMARQGGGVFVVRRQDVVRVPLWWPGAMTVVEIAENDWWSLVGARIPTVYPRELAVR